MAHMVDAVGTTEFTYYTGGMLNSEDGPWSSDTVTYTYNNRLRASLSCFKANSQGDGLYFLERLICLSWPEVKVSVPSF